MMPDREKVITGLELCTNISPDGCLMLCPYKDEKDETYSGFCEQVLKQEALALLKEQGHKDRMYHALEDDWKRLKELLKEQEAVVPYMDFDGHDVWRCGKCGATIFHIYHNGLDEDVKNYAKFCRHCGQAVKWE